MVRCQHCGKLPPPANALTIEEASRILRCSSEYLRTAIKRGDLPALLVGKRYRVFPEHLGAFIKSKRFVPIQRQRPAKYVDYSAIRRRVLAARKELSA